MFRFYCRGDATVRRSGPPGGAGRAGPVGGAGRAGPVSGAGRTGPVGGADGLLRVPSRGGEAQSSDGGARAGGVNEPLRSHAEPSLGHRNQGSLEERPGDQGATRDGAAVSSSATIGAAGELGAPRPVPSAASGGSAPAVAAAGPAAPPPGGGDVTAMVSPAVASSAPPSADA